jgi:hypothetical protein
VAGIPVSEKEMEGPLVLGDMESLHSFTVQHFFCHFLKLSNGHEKIQRSLETCF